MGEGAFLGLYSLVAAGTLAWMVLAYRATPATGPLWDVLASLFMLIASILLVGSLIGYPALPSPGARKAAPNQARDVYAITRHPMMWAFAIWGGSHILVYPIAANIVLAGGIYTDCRMAGRHLALGSVGSRRHSRLSACVRRLKG
jgi:uncharacterized membrane protein